MLNFVYVKEEGEISPRGVETPVIRIVAKKKGGRSSKKDWKTVMMAHQRERRMDKEHFETYLSV